MSTATSLNLRAVLKSAVARNDMDIPARVASGLTGSAKALYVAAAAQGQPSGVILDIAPTDLAGLLVDAGFTREDPADCHGEFAVRGCIVDIFPAGETHPVRLEFIGDTIETLRTYDPSTQRSIAPTDQIAIVPLRDVLQDDRRATLFDYLARAKSSRIIVSERDEVETNATKLLEQILNSYNEAVGRNERPLPPAELMADWDLVESRLAQATQLVRLGLDDDRTPESPSP